MEARPEPPQPDAWAIVLAGGEGTRLSPLIRRWQGRHVPKQFCAFTGAKTMLRHALERARGVAPRERVVTVIGPGQRGYVNGEAELSGAVLEQPRNLDTAAGIFLPLVYVLRRDPDAVVLVLPSDHYIAPSGRFLGHARRALGLAGRDPGRLVLLGAEPDRPEPEYGWVEPAGPSRPGEAAPVVEFCEKPEPAAARRLLEGGAWWNTLILAAKARTLWELGAAALPELTRAFGPLGAALGTPAEAAALSAAYGALEPRNVSKDLLERIPERIMVLPMRDVEWSDWGRAERIRETLLARGRARAAPARLIELLAPA